MKMNFSYLALTIASVICVSCSEAQQVDFCPTDRLDTEHTLIEFDASRNNVRQGKGSVPVRAEISDAGVFLQNPFLIFIPFENNDPDIKEVKGTHKSTKFIIKKVKIGDEKFYFSELRSQDFGDVKDQFFNSVFSAENGLISFSEHSSRNGVYGHSSYVKCSKNRLFPTDYFSDE